MKRSRSWEAFTGLLIASGGTTTYICVTTAMRTGQVSLVAAAAGFVLLWGGGFCLYVRERPPAPEQKRPIVLVDWYLTDVRAEVACPCSPGESYTVEGYTFGRFRCKSCGTFYQLQEQLNASERTDRGVLS